VSFTKIKLITFFISSVLLVAGCNNNDSNTPDPNLPPFSDGLLLEVATSTLRSGEGTKLIGTYYDDDKNSIDVSDLMSCNTSSGALYLTAQNYVVGSAGGYGNVSCTYQDQSRSLEFRINSISPISSRLVVDDTTLHRGATGQLQLIGLYADGAERDFTAYANWSTQNDSVLSVTQGTVRAHQVGSTAISVQHSRLQIESVFIQVIFTTPERIEVVQDGPFYIGVIRYLRARGYWADGDIAYLHGPVVWSASNANVRALNDAGKFLAEAEGSVTISASYEGVTGEDHPYVLDSVVLNVTTSPPSSDTIVLDEILYLQAYAHYSNGNVVDVSGEADWHQSNSNPVVSFSTIPSSNLAWLQAIREDISTAIWADYDGVSGARSSQIISVRKTSTED